MKILITVEGGCIQNIISDQPNTEVLIIDYDGTEMNVPQDDGMTSEAWVADRKAYFNVNEIDRFFKWYEIEKVNEQERFTREISGEMDDIVSELGNNKNE